MYCPVKGPITFFFVAISCAFLYLDSFAQIVDTSDSQSRVNRVLLDSGKYFREGLVDLKTKRRQESKIKFDMAVEVFLLSTGNIQRDPKLQACYTALIETIYRIEFPIADKSPQIRPLASICRWAWTAEDLKLADELTEYWNPATTSSRADITNKISEVQGLQPEQFVGFSESTFVPSLLDELAKLELTQRELDVSNATSSIYVRTIKAQAGDTVTKLAVRNGVDPTEVAKYNGLLPNSVLGAGRDIKIPTGSPLSSPLYPVSEAGRDCKVGPFPFIQHLQIGMTTREVDAALKRKAVHRKGRYVGETFVSYQGLKGLRALLLNFYNKTLYEITVYYDKSINWTGMWEFERTVAKALSLENAWQASNYCTVGRSCRIFACSNAPFKITLGEVGGFYSLNIWDPKVHSTMVTAEANRRLAEERKKQLEQERRKSEFKP